MKKSWALILSCILLIMLLSLYTSHFNAEEKLRVQEAKPIEKPITAEDKSKENVNETDAKALIDRFNKADLKRLLVLYDSKLDGATAEGFGFNILKEFRKTKLKVFIKELSSYDKDAVEGVLTLLIGEFYIEEDRKELVKIEMTLNELKKNEKQSKQETYVIYEFLAQIKYHAIRE